MLEFVDVALSYRLRGAGLAVKPRARVQALRDISFRVEGGAFCLLSGPSGAGKTSILNLVLGLRKPDRGSVRVAERPLERLRRSSLPYVRRNVGAVMQESSLLSGATPLQNVALALEVLGRTHKQIVAAARVALEHVEMDPATTRPVAELSAGERQRVTLARALATDPPLLLADEPTSNLDPRLAEDMLGLLAAARERGTTIVLASHDPWLCGHPVIDQVVNLDCGVVMGVEHRAGSEPPSDSMDSPLKTLTASDEASLELEMFA